MSLPDYVGRMKPGRRRSTSWPATDARRCANSAQLEGFRAQGVEVLLLTDPVDAFWPDRLDEFDGKPLRSVTQGAADLDKLARRAGGGDAAGRDRAGRRR